MIGIKQLIIYINFIDSCWVFLRNNVLDLMSYFAICFVLIIISSSFSYFVIFFLLIWKLCLYSTCAILQRKAQQNNHQYRCRTVILEKTNIFNNEVKTEQFAKHPTKTNSEINSFLHENLKTKILLVFPSWIYKTRENSRRGKFFK